MDVYKKKLLNFGIDTIIMVPLTQKQFTSSFSEERLERLNRFAGERQAQLPVSSDEESKFFSHVLWKSCKKKRFSANLTEF
jgi:hypothetical protein